MENRLRRYLKEKTIWKILITANIISIEDSVEKGINVFNNLDKKYNYLDLFRELSKINNHKIGDAVKSIRDSVDDSIKKKEPYQINMIKVILRGYIHEAKLKKDKLLEDNPEMEEIEEIKQDRQLNSFNFTEFMNIDDKKIYYVNRMFASSTINMIFAPPKNMKSFVSYYLALCIAQGKNFFNQKTKKVSVCYFDWENPIGDVQNRLKGICKGMDFNPEDLNNLHFFPRQSPLLRVEKYGAVVYEDLKEELIAFIKENDIKIIFFDTLRRLGNFEENDSGTINMIKSDLFDPIIKETSACIIFLHHTSKEGNTYRGSVDIEGIIDTSFKINKIQKNDYVNLKISCAARRNNEIDLISSAVTISNNSYEDDDGDMVEEIDEVIFERTISNDDGEENYSDYRALMIEKLDPIEEYKNKELVDLIKSNTQVSSTNTLNRVIRWLVKANILLKTGVHKNTRYNLNPQLKKGVEVQTYYKGEDTTHELVQKHLHKMFKEADIVKKKQITNDPKNNLNGLFDVKYVSVVLNDWNTKGWLILSNEKEIRVTEKYKEMNKNER